MCEALIRDGHQVMGLDNYSRGLYEAEFIRKGDVRHRTSLACMYDFQPEVVFHLAAEVWGVKVAQKHNYDMMRHNMAVDAAVLGAAVEVGAKRIIYPSTACVYPVENQSEWDSVLSEDMAWGKEAGGAPHPESGYGWAKLMGEVQVRHLPIEWVVFRLFNVYGEGENHGAGSHVIPELIRKTLAAPEGGTMQVYGDGSAGRTFLHVSDAVRAYQNAIECEPGTTMNIGNPEPVRIRELAQKIVKIDGREVLPVYDPSQPEGVKGRTPDITRAREVLSWEPKVGLDEGLKRAYGYYVAKRRVYA